MLRVAELTSEVPRWSVHTDSQDEVLNRLWGRELNFWSVGGQWYLRMAKGYVAIHKPLHSFLLVRAYPTNSLHYIMHPLLLLECRSDTPSRTLCPSIMIKLSTSHSYQTFRSSVCLQKLTSTSELAGSCIGICSSY